MNYVLFDVGGYGLAPTLADLVLEVGGGVSGGWKPAPTPTYGYKRFGGASGSDRVSLRWADGAIANTWLRVTVLPSARTGLMQPDVFYFGNLIGETGGPRTLAVDVSDVARTRANFGRTTAAALAASDFNRDGVVDGADVLIVRKYQHRSLQLFTAPNASPPAGVVTASGSGPGRALGTPARRGVLANPASSLLR
jgi:hypothetical protein